MIAIFSIAGPSGAGRPLRGHSVGLLSDLSGTLSETTLRDPKTSQKLSALFYLWPEGRNPRVGTPSGGIRENGASYRVFLNLWFAKPMVWVRVAFHENDGNHENDENDEDNSDSYKQGVECWIRGNHGNHENDENHENPGCKPRVPQTTGLEIPDLRGL